MNRQKRSCERKEKAKPREDRILTLTSDSQEGLPGRDSPWIAILGVFPRRDGSCLPGSSEISARCQALGFARINAG